jgi:hypothetical protein
MTCPSGPGILRTRIAAIPYQEVLFREAAYQVVGTSEQNMSFFSTGDVFWHRHFVPWPIMLRGYTIAIGATTPPTGTYGVKMALYTAKADTKLPDLKVAESEVTWATGDIVLAPDNLANCGRSKTLGTELRILTPGVYWVGVRYTAIGTAGTVRANSALDPSVLPASTQLRFDVRATITGSDLPVNLSGVTLVSGDGGAANVIVGLLCNRLIS